MSPSPGFPPVACLGMLLGLALAPRVAAEPTYLSCADLNNNRVYYAIDTRARVLRAYDDGYEAIYTVPIEVTGVAYSWRVPQTDTDGGTINRVTLQYSLHTRPGGWQFWIGRHWIYEGLCQVLDGLPGPRI
jgi:hypothetical protein